MDRIYFKHGTDVNGTQFTIVGKGEQKQNGTKFSFGVTACSTEDDFNFYEGRKKAVMFLNEKPYSYVTTGVELITQDNVQKHLKCFVRKFSKKSIRKFIYEKRS